MHARMTQLEIDTVRCSVDEALRLFTADVLPQLRQQPGFCGVEVLSTPDGRAVITTYWHDGHGDATGLEAQWYRDMLGHYAPLFRSPPGRGWYKVLLATPIVDTTTAAAP